MTTIHVLGISGSLRKESYNTKLLRAAAAMSPEDMTLEIFDLTPIPPYNEDVRQHGYPEAVQALRERIAAADAVLIATPEYNGSLSGVLKNALDWASRSPNPPLNEKPTAIMGATTGNFGTAKAQVHLRDVCVSLNMFLVNKPGVLVMRAQDKFDADGRLVDETARGFLKALLEALAAWTRRLRDVPN
jgi:chromate reductase